MAETVQKDALKFRMQEQRKRKRLDAVLDKITGRSLRSTSGDLSRKTSTKDKSHPATLTKSQAIKNNNQSEKTKQEKHSIFGESLDNSNSDMIQNAQGRIISSMANLLPLDPNCYSKQYDPGFPKRNVASLNENHPTYPFQTGMPLEVMRSFTEVKVDPLIPIQKTISDSLGKRHLANVKTEEQPRRNKKYPRLPHISVSGNGNIHQPFLLGYPMCQDFPLKADLIDPKMLSSNQPIHPISPSRSLTPTTPISPSSQSQVGLQMLLKEERQKLGLTDLSMDWEERLMSPTHRFLLPTKQFASARASPETNSPTTQDSPLDLSIKSSSASSQIDDEARGVLVKKRRNAKVIKKTSRQASEATVVHPSVPSDSSVQFVCPNCSLVFNTQDRLAKHITSRHKAKGGGGDMASRLPHICTLCNRTFARSDMLTRHMRLHTGIKPYTCRICGQVFSRSDHLSTHQRTHTGEKPYQCSTCPYAACRRDMITRHLRTHARYEPNDNLPKRTSPGSGSTQKGNNGA